MKTASPCDPEQCVCGCDDSRCRAFDSAGLCPSSSPSGTSAEPKLVVGVCTSTAERAGERRERFGRPLGEAGLQVVYLLNATAAETGSPSFRSGPFRMQTSSACPSSLKAWANPGERCAWSQIVDLYASFPEADWYALGDDDTLWVPQNLIQALSTFSPKKNMYLGGLGNDKELQVSSQYWSGDTNITGDMAFGGAGMVLSHAIMVQLQGQMAGCLQDSREMYGGDERISFCIRQICKTGPHVMPGLHQLDYFDPTHLFHLHPRSPVLALHHLLEPTVFDAISHRGLSLGKLQQGIAADPFNFLQGRQCKQGHDMFLIAPGFQVYWFKHGVAYVMLMFDEWSQSGNEHRMIYRHGSGRSLQQVTTVEDAQSLSWAHDRPQYCCQVQNLKQRPRQAVLQMQITEQHECDGIGHPATFDSLESLLLSSTIS